LVSVSNPTSRVIDVLNFLAAHPTDAFTLAEISAHVGMSGASAYRVLRTLEGGSYLSRHPKHKTYTLGMAPVAIGQAALERHRGIEIARREIARLAAELNLRLDVDAIVEDEMILLAKEGAPQSPTGMQRVGERIPLIAPVGMCMMAWSDDARVEAYLGRSRPHVSPQIVDHLRASLRVIRRRGFSLALSGPAMPRTHEVMTLPLDRRQDAAYWSSLHAFIGAFSAAEFQLLDLEEGGAFDVGYISVPVFCPSAKPVLELVMTGLPHGLSGAQVRTLAERLCAAGAIVTSETFGKRPVDQQMAGGRAMRNW
jgi:DNA-binding IclR family transcriptional regulator